MSDDDHEGFDVIRRIAQIDTTVGVLTESVVDLRQFVDNIKSQVGEFARQLRCEELTIVNALAKYQNVLLRMHLLLAQSKLALERNINSSTRVIQEHYRNTSQGRVDVETCMVQKIRLRNDGLQHDIGDVSTASNDIITSPSDSKINQPSTSYHQSHHQLTTDSGIYLSSISDSPLITDSQTGQLTADERVDDLSDSEIDAETDYAHRFLAEIRHEVLPFIMRFPDIGKKFRLFKQTSDPQRNSLLLPTLYGHRAVGTQTEVCACSKKQVLRVARNETPKSRSSHVVKNAKDKHSTNKDTNNKYKNSKGVQKETTKIGNNHREHSKDKKVMHGSKSESSERLHEETPKHNNKNKCTDTKDKHKASHKTLTLKDVDIFNVKSSTQDKVIKQQSNSSRKEELKTSKCEKQKSNDSKENGKYKSKDLNKSTQQNISKSSKHKNSVHHQNSAQKEPNKPKQIKESKEAFKVVKEYIEASKRPNETQFTLKSVADKAKQSQSAKIKDNNEVILQNQSNVAKERALTSLNSPNTIKLSETSNNNKEPTVATNNQEFIMPNIVEANNNILNSHVISICTTQLIKQELNIEPTKNINIYYEDSDMESDTTLVLEENYEPVDVKPNILIVKTESIQPTEDTDTQNSDGEQILQHCDDPKLISQVPVIVLQNINTNKPDNVHFENSKSTDTDINSENLEKTTVIPEVSGNTIENIKTTQTKNNIGNNKNESNSRVRINFQDFKLKYKERFENTPNLNQSKTADRSKIENNSNKLHKRKRCRRRRCRSNKKVKLDNANSIISSENVALDAIPAKPRRTPTYSPQATNIQDIANCLPPQQLSRSISSTCIRPEEIQASAVNSIYQFNQQDKNKHNTKSNRHAINEKVIYLPPRERDNFAFNEAVNSICDARKKPEDFSRHKADNNDTGYSPNNRDINYNNHSRYKGINRNSHASNYYAPKFQPEANTSSVAKRREYQEIKRTNNIRDPRLYLKGFCMESYGRHPKPNEESHASRKFDNFRRNYRDMLQWCSKTRLKQ